MGIDEGKGQAGGSDSCDTVSGWSGWTEGTKTCGGGVKKRVRVTLKSDAEVEQEECPLVQTEPCANIKCYYEFKKEDQDFYNQVYPTPYAKTDSQLEKQAEQIQGQALQIAAANLTVKHLRLTIESFEVQMAGVKET